MFDEAMNDIRHGGDAVFYCSAGHAGERGERLRSTFVPSSLWQ